MAFTETIADFFSTDDFAVAATYDGSTVNGIFDHEYVEVENVEGERPVFLCASSDVSGAAHGESITIEGTAYTIAGIQPDGTGLTLLILSE